MSVTGSLPNRRQLNLRGLIVTLAGALALGGLLTLPMLASGDDWAGWLFLYASPCVLLAFPEFRANRKLFYVGLLVIAAHQAVALVNRYIGIGLFSTGDPVDFHREAALIGRGEDSQYVHLFGTAEFVYFLGFFYRIFGPNLLLGEQVSILIFSCTCGVFVRLLNEWNIRREQPLYLGLFGLLPAVVMFTSVTLREACELFLFLLCLLTVLRFRQTPTLGRMAGLTVYVVFLALFHSGLILFGAIFFVMCMWWGLAASQEPHIIWLRIFSRAVVATLAGVLAAVGQKTNDVIIAIGNGRIFEYLGMYRAGLKGFVGTRANYDIPISFTSPLAGLYGVWLAFVYYLLAPFPWQVGNAMDIYVMVEGWLRVGLLLFGIGAWRRAEGETRRRYGFLLATVLIMELFWAVGTGNWGTGVRHHVLVWGPTLMLGGPGLLHWISRQYRAVAGLPPIEQGLD